MEYHGQGPRYAEGIDMIYHIAVCDDCEADSVCLTEFVKQWAMENHTAVQADIFASAEAFLFHYEENKTYDILLLDVEMGRLNGVELARRIRMENSAVQIIFVTGYSDYIADGYDVAALHYLVKPVDRGKLFSVLGRARDALLRQERRLLLNMSGETARIPLHEVRYIEVRGNYVTVHAKEEYTLKSTLAAIEKQLDDSFFRAGRSYIINLGYIRRVGRTQAELENGEQIPLSRGMYEPLNRAIINMA